MYFATEMISALKINIPTTLLLKDFKKIDISILQNWASYFTEAVDYLKSTGKGIWVQSNREQNPAMSGWVEDSNLERPENKSSTLLPKLLQDLNVKWNLVDLPLVLNI